MESAEKNCQHSNVNFDYDDRNDIISWFERVTENAGLVQTQTLRRILELNHNTEYLKRWLGDIKIQELEDSALEKLYKNLMTLSTYADFEPFIQRIADGDTSPLLTQQPITAFSISSGTTEGRHKYIPFTQHFAQNFPQISRLAAAYRLRAYPTKEGGRFLEFTYCNTKKFETKGGLMVGSVSTNYYTSPEMIRHKMAAKLFSCSPQEVITSGDYKQATYCHLLLGLFFSDQVEFITSIFAHVVLGAFTAFEEIWKELCSDIREGTLSTRINCPKLQKAVLDIISPNPRLASKIEVKCKELENLNWSGLIPELWPNAKYVCCVTSGSMQPYLKKLRHYAMDLPIVGTVYASSESLIGFNVDPCSPPEHVTYAVVPTFSYFEFIPLHKEKQNSISMTDDFIEDEPVPLSQVKIGQEYEIVLTTFTGLYRYRLGDVVEVVGFHNGTPKLNFICRKKLLLSVAFDKTTEKDLQIVVERGSKLLVSEATKAELVDFTSHANTDTEPGHYVIYWEIKGEVDERVLQDCCTEMDGSFIEIAYVAHRKRNFVGPLELRVVEPGTFKKILDYFIGNGVTFGQFKTPRCTKNEVILGILNASTIKRFYSTAYED